MKRFFVILLFTLPFTLLVPHRVVAKTIENRVVTLEGVASYYSRAGCIGCSKTMTMANGEPLDDSRMTIAENTLPLNTMVLVVNERNKKQVIAKVTDRGGFTRYHRIADLGLAVARTIDLKTDVDIITITPVK